MTQHTERRTSSPNDPHACPHCGYYKREQDRRCIECEMGNDPTPEQVAAVLHSGGRVTAVHGRLMGKATFQRRVNAELRRLDGAAEQPLSDDPS